jgi:putative transposase
MIAAEKPNKQFPVARMCGWAGVSESGFYAWAKRMPSATAQRRAALSLLILEIFTASNGVFGYRKVHAELCDRGEKVCDRVVRDIMAEQGLESCHPAPWRHLTQPDGTPPAPDLIGREFTATRPGVRLVGDITHIDTWEGPLFLATVIDLYNREIIGWSMAEHHRASLVCEAIVMAKQNRRIRRRAVFHSDRGAEYTSGDFRRCLKLNGRLRSSMGQVGCAYDNAVAESFFAAIKKELVHRTEFPTRARAIDAVANYIEVFYNHQRPHQSLSYQTPAAHRAAYQTNQKSAA